MLSHYQFLWRVNANTEPVTTVVTIGEEIEPNKVLSHKDDVEFFKERLAPDGFVANADGNGTPFLAYASPDFDKCYLMVFFSQDAPELQSLNSFYAKSNVKLVTAKVDKASLFYYSTNDGAQYPYWKLFDAVTASGNLRGRRIVPRLLKPRGIGGTASRSPDPQCGAAAKAASGVGLPVAARMASASRVRPDHRLNAITRYAI
jgi:hypothetical protein